MLEISEGIIDLIRKNYILAEEVVAQLRARGWSMATAESITAGYVSGFIASVPGASECLRGGIVAYSPQSKLLLLNISEKLIQITNGVSPEIAKLMAEKARTKLCTHIAISTTGFAGPSGRELGLLYLGVSTLQETNVYQKSIHPRLPYSLQREEIRLQASMEALALTLKTIKSLDRGI
jgi:PncC family amidohydrolase